MFIYSEDLKNFNEIFRKDVAYDNIKSHTKKQGVTLSLSLSLSLSVSFSLFLSNTFFELTPPPFT